MNNTLLLIVGASGTGKTTIANILGSLCKLSQIESYTTRPPRYDDEKGHIFLTDDEFDNIADNEMVAYTEINGYRYCATKEQVEKNDIYVIDLIGVEDFLQRYKGDKQIKVVYLYASRSTRFNRMLDRGDSIMDAATRLENDDINFSRERANEVLSNFRKEDVLRFMATDKLRAAEKIYNYFIG